MRRLLAIAVTFGALIALPLIALAQTQSPEEQKSWFLQFVQDRLSTPERQISISNIDGALSSAGDALAARISPEWALVLTEPGGEEVLVPKLESAAGSGAMVTDATHLFAGFALAGPSLPDVLERLTSWDPASLKPGSATGAPIADVRAVAVRRDLDVPVMEAYVATEFARYAWEAVLDAVRRTGGAPVGWNALRAQGWS